MEQSPLPLKILFVASGLKDRRTDPTAAGANLFAAEFVQTPSLKVHCLRRSGSGPTLVALHGLFGSGECLKPLACALDQRLDIILPDSRGHGDTDAPDGGFLYPDLANDLIDLIRCLRLEHPILLGHSMGGMSTCLAASRLGDRIAALILVDPTFLDANRQREVFESNVGRDHEEQLKRSREELLLSAASRTPSRSAELRRALVDARARTNVRAVEVLTPPNPEFVALIASIQVPILLVTGSNGIVSTDVAKMLRSTYPLVSHHHLDGPGHGMPYDEPQTVALVINSFLEGLSL